MEILRLSSVGSKFAKFLMSFFKAQVSSSSNFPSFFSVMTHNSSILAWLEHNILSTKVAHQSANFRLTTARTKIHLTSYLEPRVNFSSNFAPFFSDMRHNSSVLFELKLYMLLTNGDHQSANFQTFDCLHEI